MSALSLENEVTFIFSFFFGEGIRKNVFTRFHFIYVYGCMVCSSGGVSTGACRGLKKLLDSLELELHLIVSCMIAMLGAKLGSST